MSTWLFNVYIDAVMKEVNMGMGRRGESGDYLASCMQMTWFCVNSQSEENLRTMMGQLVDVCRRRGPKVNGGKSKVMVLNGEEGLESEVYVDGIRLECVS